MRKLILLVICCGFLACNDGNPLPTENLQESFTISGTDNLEFQLATAIPIEGGFSIHQQAEHFEVSEIQYQDQGVFYVYSPEEGFTGTDLVKIKRADSNGAEIVSETIITLNIKVTE